MSFMVEYKWFLLVIFFQLFPVGPGYSLAIKETIQFGAINKAVFLNKSQRFTSDPKYGENEEILCWNGN